MNEMERLQNEPYEIVIGTRGKSRTLRLSEPPMMALLGWIKVKTEEFKKACKNDSSMLDKVLAFASRLESLSGEGGASVLSLVDTDFFEPLFRVICELAEILDDCENPEVRVADAISANQFLKLIPPVLEIVNLEELKANFMEALGAVGIKIEMIPEKKISQPEIEVTEESTSSPAH